MCRGLFHLSVMQAGSETECERIKDTSGPIINCLVRFLTFCLSRFSLYVRVCVCVSPPECTIDHHFVFTVPASITEPPLSPALLVAASNSTCKPQRVTPDYALFKIPMDGCGARRVVSSNQ